MHMYRSSSSSSSSSSTPKAVKSETFFTPLPPVAQEKRGQNDVKCAWILCICVFMQLSFSFSLAVKASTMFSDQGYRLLLSIEFPATKRPGFLSKAFYELKVVDPKATPTTFFVFLGFLGQPIEWGVRVDTWKNDPEKS